MSDNVMGQRVLMFVDDIYEDLELWYPRLRLIEAGALVTVAGPAADRVYAGKHGYPCRSDAALADMQSADFEGLVIPGGFMPDKLRRDPKVLSLVWEFAGAGKLVAAICHGPWVLCSAGMLKGRTATSFFAIKDDVVNAGAHWVDAEVVVDNNLVTSRKPEDLPAFCKASIQVLETVLV